MHHVSVTEGIVLMKRGVGEANTLVSMLTEDMGLVRASARSTRVEGSKLRYGLEPMTLARYSFVKGRHEWRLTGAERASRELLPPTASSRAAAGRISKLLLRLIRGEEEGKALFHTVRQGLSLLAAAKDIDEAGAIECILVLRVLSHLGYLPQTQELAPFVEGDFASQELAASARAFRPYLIRTINESLMHTGL